MFYNNQAAIGMAEQAQFSKKTKYIAIYYHYVRDLVAIGVIEMEFMPITNILADSLTKAIEKEKFGLFVKAICII